MAKPLGAPGGMELSVMAGADGAVAVARCHYRPAGMAGGGAQLGTQDGRSFGEARDEAKGRAAQSEAGGAIPRLRRFAA